MKEIQVTVSPGTKDSLPKVHQVVDSRTNQPLPLAEENEFWQTLRKYYALTLPDFPIRDMKAEKILLLKAYQESVKRNATVVEAYHPVIDMAITLPQHSVEEKSSASHGGEPHFEDKCADREDKGVEHYVGECVSEGYREGVKQYFEKDIARQTRNLTKRSKNIATRIEGFQEDVDGLIYAGCSPKGKALSRAQSNLKQALGKQSYYDAKLGALCSSRRLLSKFATVHTAVDVVGDVKTAYEDKQRISELSRSLGLPYHGQPVNAALAFVEGVAPVLTTSLASIVFSPRIGIPLGVGCEAALDYKRKRAIDELVSRSNRRLPPVLVFPFRITIAVKESPVLSTTISSPAESLGSLHATPVSTTLVQHVAHDTKKPPSTISLTGTTFSKVNVGGGIPSLSIRSISYPVIPKITGLDWKKIFYNLGHPDPNKPPSFIFTGLYNYPLSRNSDPAPDIRDRLNSHIPHHPEHGAFGYDNGIWWAKFTDPNLIAVGLALQAGYSVYSACRYWFADSTTRARVALVAFQNAWRDGWRNEWWFIYRRAIPLMEALEEVIVKYPESSSLWRAIRLAYNYEVQNKDGTYGRWDLIAQCQCPVHFDRATPEQLRTAFGPVLDFQNEYVMKIWQQVDFIEPGSYFYIEQLKKHAPDSLGAHLAEAEYCAVQAFLSKDPKKKAELDRRAKQAFAKADETAKELDRVAGELEQAAIHRGDKDALARYTNQVPINKSVSLVEAAHDHVHAIKSYIRTKEIQPRLKKAIDLLDRETDRLRNAKTPEEQKTAEDNLTHSVSAYNVLVEELAEFNVEVCSAKPSYLKESALVIGGVYKEQKNFTKAKEHFSTIAKANPEAKRRLDCVEADELNQDLDDLRRRFNASYDPSILVSMNEKAQLLKQKGVDLQSYVDSDTQNLGKACCDNSNACLQSIQKIRPEITTGLQQQLEKIKSNLMQASLDKIAELEQEFNAVVAALYAFNPEGQPGSKKLDLDATSVQVGIYRERRGLATEKIDKEKTRFKQAKSTEEKDKIAEEIESLALLHNFMTEKLAVMDATTQAKASLSKVDPAIIVSDLYADAGDFGKAKGYLSDIAADPSRKSALDRICAVELHQCLVDLEKKFTTDEDPTTLSAMDEKVQLLKQKSIELQSSADKFARDLGKQYSDSSDTYSESVRKKRADATVKLFKELNETKKELVQAPADQVDVLEREITKIISKFHEFNPPGQTGSKDLVLDSHLELADVHRRRNDVASVRKHLKEVSVNASLPVSNRAKIELIRLEQYHSSGVASIIADVGFSAVDRAMMYFAEQALSDTKNSFLSPSIAQSYLKQQPLLKTIHAVGISLWRAANLCRFQQNHGGSLLQGITRESLQSVLYSAATANALSQLALYLFNNNENWYGKIATVSAHTTQTALAAYTNFQSLSETAKVIRAGQNIWTVNASLSLSTRVSKLGSLATVSAVNSALNVASLAGNIFVNIDASRRLLGKRIWDGNKMIFVKDTASVLSTGTFFGGIVYAGSLAIGSPVSMPVYLGTTLTFAAIHAGERLWSRNNYGNTDELFHNAHVCLRENKGKEALELAVECAHKVPHKKDYQSFYLNLLANDKLNSGEFASARNICDNALQLNVDVDQFLMLRAQSEVGLGKISEAISDFRKVDELNLPGEKSATTRGAAQQYLAEIAVELNPREIPYPIVNYAAGAVNAAEEDLHAAERARDNYSQAILSPYVDMVANNRFLGPICEAGNFYPNAYLRYRDDRERMATLDDMRKQYAMRYRLLECAVQLNALWRREVNNYNRWNYFFCSHQVPDFEHDKMVKRLAYSGTDPLYEARYNLNLAEKIECRPFLQVAKHLRECFAQTDDELGMSKMIHQKMGCLEQRLRVCDQQLTQSTTKALCLSGGDIPEFAHNRIVSELVHHSQIEDPVAAIEACQSLVTSCRGSFFSMSLRRPWHLSLAVGSALRDGLSSFGLFRNRTSADSTVASDCKSDNGQLLSL